MPRSSNHSNLEAYYKSIIYKLPPQCQMVFKNHTKLVNFDGKKAEIRILRDSMQPLILANLSHLHRAFPSNNGQGVIIRLLPPTPLKVVGKVATI